MQPYAFLGQELAHQEGQFVWGALCVGGDTPMVGEFACIGVTALVAGVDTDDGLGVSDVDDDDHGAAA